MESTQPTNNLWQDILKHLSLQDLSSLRSVSRLTRSQVDYFLLGQLILSATSADPFAMVPLKEKAHQLKNSLVKHFKSGFSYSPDIIRLAQKKPLEAALIKMILGVGIAPSDQALLRFWREGYNDTAVLWYVARRSTQEKDREKKIQTVLKRLPKFILLQQCVMDNLDLSNMDLSYADLTQATFNHTLLDKANLSHASVIQSRFSNIDVAKVCFDYADIKDTSFIDVNLGKTSFRYAKLTSIDFTGVDLSAVDFTGAVIAGCQFDLSAYHNLTLVKASIESVKTLQDLALIEKTLQDYDQQYHSHTVHTMPTLQSIQLAQARLRFTLNPKQAISAESKNTAPLPERINQYVLSVLLAKFNYWQLIQLREINHLMRTVVDRYMLDKVLQMANYTNPLALALNRREARHLVTFVRRQLPLVIQNESLDPLLKKLLQYYCDQGGVISGQSLLPFWQVEKDICNDTALLHILALDKNQQRRPYKIREVLLRQPKYLKLDGVDLSRTPQYEINFSYLVASNSSFSFSSFSQTYFSYAILSDVNFDGCSFDRCAFIGARFHQVNFLPRSVRGSDFSGVIIDKGSIFNAVALENTSFFKSLLNSVTSFAASVDFVNQVHQLLETEKKYHGFSQLTPQHIQLLKQRHQELVNFGSTIVVNKPDDMIFDFSGFHIKGACIESSNLKKVSFKAAVISDVKMTQTDLTGSDFSAASFKQVIFTDCNLEKIDFTGVSFQDCAFNNCQFSVDTYNNTDLITQIITSIKEPRTILRLVDAMIITYRDQFGYESFAANLPNETIGIIKQQLLASCRGALISKQEFQSIKSFLGLPRYGSSLGGWLNWSRDRLFDTGLTDSVRQFNQMVATGVVQLKAKSDTVLENLTLSPR